MSDTQITLEFLANTDGLKAAAQQMQLLGKVSKEQYALFVKANRDAQQAIAAMAKESAATGKVLQVTTAQATQLSEQFRQMGQFIATGAVSQFATQFATLAAQIIEGNNTLTALTTQLNQLQQAINSGGLEGEALAKAKDNAAGLLEQIKNATEASAKLAQGLNSTKVYGEALNAVVAGLAAAQSGSALFGVESERLQQALLKAQQATAFLTSAQQTYGATLRIGEAIQKQFAVSSAAAWAAATGGLTILVSGIAALVAYMGNAETQTNELTNAQRNNKLELEKLGIEYLLAAGSIDAYTAKTRTLKLETDKNLEDIRQNTKKQLKDIQDSWVNHIPVFSLFFVGDRIKKENEVIKKGKEEEAAIVNEANARQAIIDANETRRQLEERKRREEEMLRLLRKRLDEQEVLLKSELQQYVNADEGLRNALIEQGNNTSQDADRRIQYYFLGGLTKEEIAQRLADTLSEADQNAADVINSKQPGVDAGYFKDVWEQGKQASADYVESVKNDWAKLTGIINDENSSPYLVQLAQIAKAKLELQLFVQYAQQASDTIFQVVANQLQAELQAQQQKLTRQRELELQNKNLTEQQKEAITRRYADQEAKLKRRAYEQDKQSKIAQAAINGALAITNILATRPKSDFGIGDAIMIATAVASTAAQIAVIASTPVPQFARGGKNIPAGMKLVGEQGPELIWTPGGETVIPHGDTAKILEAWSIPVPAVNPVLKTDAAIAAALPAGIDYNKLAQAFAQELRNNPSVNISMDNNGFAMHLLQKNKSVQLLNNRYSA
jgi:hypothetical protein